MLAPNLYNAVATLANTLLAITAAGAVIMILYGAFLYLISAGDALRVKQAHSTMLWSLVGLAVVLGSKGIILTECSFLGLRCETTESGSIQIQTDSQIVSFIQQDYWQDGTIDWQDPFYDNVFNLPYYPDSVQSAVEGVFMDYYTKNSIDGVINWDDPFYDIISEIPTSSEPVTSIIMSGTEQVDFNNTAFDDPATFSFEQRSEALPDIISIRNLNMDSNIAPADQTVLLARLSDAMNRVGPDIANSYNNIYILGQLMHLKQDSYHLLGGRLPMQIQLQIMSF